MLIPYINIVVLLILNHRATTAIRSAGFSVGLMGANLQEIKSKLASKNTTLIL